MGNRKITLHHNITALQKINYKCKNSDTQIWMKRDDTLDFAFGGNKVRLYEYISPEINKENYEKIVTFGSVYSNHNRVTAAVAAYLGLECDLIVLCDDNNQVRGAIAHLSIIIIMQILSTAMLMMPMIL